MKYENIENQEVKALVQRFYVYQCALRDTPLGEVGINNRATYPKYFQRFQSEFQSICSELLKIKVDIQEITPPETTNSPNALERLTMQPAIQLILVTEDGVIYPPKHLDLMVQNFLSRLSTPWH